MRDRIEGVLERIRGHLGVDGGDVQLVNIEGGVVTIRLVGGCTRCPMSQIALVTGIENALITDGGDVHKVVVLK